MSLTATTTVTTTEHVALTAAQKVRLRRALKTYAELKAQIKALEMAAEKEKAAVRTIREDAGVESLTFEGFKATNVTSTRTSLDKMKLLEMGVTTSMLDEATVSKPGRPYERISIPGDKEDQ